MWQIFKYSKGSTEILHWYVALPQRKRFPGTGTLQFSAERSILCMNTVDKTARLIIRMIFGFASDGICQTQPKWLQILRRQGHEQIKQRFTLYIFHFWFSSHCGSCLAINSQFSNKHDFLQTTPTLTLIRKAALAEQLLVVSLRDLAGALLPLVETPPAPPSISLLSQSRCQHKDRKQCCNVAKLTKTSWIHRELT